MRGVHDYDTPIDQASTGSSPHARGPHWLAKIDCSGDRIIPACAGSTIPSCVTVMLWKDHPRMRGVHVGAGSHFPMQLGSSPHARGPRSEGCAYL